MQIPTEMIHYGMSKTAQLSLTRGSRGAREVRSDCQCRVAGTDVAEGVGGFLENLAKAQGKTVAEIEKGFFGAARPTSLLKRFIDPEEVANVVAFVCSREASAIDRRADPGGRRCYVVSRRRGRRSAAGKRCLRLHAASDTSVPARVVLANLVGAEDLAAHRDVDTRGRRPAPWRRPCRD